MQGDLREVNIKENMPTVQEAVSNLNTVLRSSRQLGYSAVKIIHGYGSSGRGGKIRLTVRRRLTEMKQKRQIRDFIPGETFSIFEEATRQAFIRCDDLRRDHDLDRHNNGITIIIF